MQGDELLTNIFFVTVYAKCDNFSTGGGVLGMDGSKIPSHKGEEIRLMKIKKIYQICMWIISRS